MPNIHEKINGQSDLAADGDVDKTVIAAQGSGSKLRIRSGVIAVTVAANGTNGIAALEDGAGGTKLVVFSAGVIGNTAFDFGENGPVLSDNTLLNLTVEGAGTTQGSARIMVVADVLGKQ